MNSPEPAKPLQSLSTSIPSLGQGGGHRAAANHRLVSGENPAIPSARAAAFPTPYFAVIILLSAISVFAIVVLVVWELVDKSRLSLHQFGLQLLLRARLGPGQRQLRSGAVYLRHAGFVVSGIAAGGAAVRRRCRVYHGDVPATAARHHFLPGGVAGGDSQRDLRLVGNLRAGAPAARVC